MAEFFSRFGQRTIRSESTWWHEVQPGVLLSFPYYRVLEPDRVEIDKLLRHHRLWALRYATPPSGIGFDTTVPLNTNAVYDLGALHQKARNQTYRALENCTVNELSFDDLMTRGLSLNEGTAKRQGRDSEYADPAYWRKYCNSAKATSGFSAWAAWVDGKLGAYLIVAAFDGWVNWLVQNSATALLNKRPNNALVYETARHFLRDTEYKRICYGLGSLENVAALDRFKQRMGWTLQPVRQRIAFAPGIRRSLALVREPMLKLATRAFPKSYFVRKTAAMIRLYRTQDQGTLASDADVSQDGPTD